MEFESYNNWFSKDEQGQESRLLGTSRAVSPPTSYSPFKLFGHPQSSALGTPTCVTPSSMTSTSPSSATSNSQFDLPTPASKINWSDILCCDCKCKVSKVLGAANDFAPMKRKLNYDVNFGSFGIEVGQFSEPAGICVTVDGFIAITDTKNHRIQVFDEIGCLKLSFGTPGTNPGQILYPNCIASCPATRNFVITERTPVHQVQVYSSTGQFIRRFGQNFIQFPRGVCVDKGGNIIIVECKVMRVTIFDQLGTVIRTFCVPNVMSFPMGICCNENYEIFVVDNRKHCIHVFDYNGTTLRTMCTNGSISFPISININAAGELVVTDNHQSFNMTFFTQAGELLRGYESRNRHPQCLAAAVLGVDKIFLATKDFRVYGYDCSKGK